MHYLPFELIRSRQIKIILLPRTQVYHEADKVIFYQCGFSSHFPTSPTLFKVIAPLTCCVWNESLSPTIFLVTSTLTLSLALPALFPGGQNSCPLSQWCYLTISSSVTPFSSCPQSFPAPTTPHPQPQKWSHHTLISAPGNSQQKPWKTHPGDQPS